MVRLTDASPRGAALGAVRFGVVAAALTLWSCGGGSEGAAGEEILGGSLVRIPTDLDGASGGFAGAFTMAAGYASATRTLTVTLDIAEGFHAYAPGEEVGRPVALRLDASGGWEQVGETRIPAGRTVDLGQLGTSRVLAGRVTLAAEVVGGSDPIRGEVRVQICTDDTCDRPRWYPFEVPAS